MYSDDWFYATLSAVLNLQLSFLHWNRHNKKNVKAFIVIMFSIVSFILHGVKSHQHGCSCMSTLFVSVQYCLLYSPWSKVSSA